MKEIIQKLISHQVLSENEAREVMKAIADGGYPPAQIAAFITTYMMRPIHVSELEGFRSALLELALPFDPGPEDCIDMCGTGGDGKNSFNISTLASLVVAGAGYRVVKHGNYGVSSVCGSSNVLEHLGYQFTNNQEELRRQLDTQNICFLHAPLFHPAMKAVGPVRKELGMKTFFNMLGPLVNPARPTHQFVGVFSQEMSRLYKYLLQKSDTKNFCVVYSMDGYDEISLTGPFLMATRETEEIYHPENLSISLIVPEEIFGGDTIEEAAAIFTKVLAGDGSKAQNKVVCANAAGAIHCLKPQRSFENCFSEALESLQSGSANRTLQNLIQSNSKVFSS